MAELTATEEMSARPLVSVIIPVFNDAVRLENCLRSLRAQAYPPSSLEIIVVDNGSDDDLESVVRPGDRVRLIRELETGSFAARNAGVRIARGSILAFTDADGRPDRNWISAGVEILRSTSADYLGGRTELLFRDPNRLTAAELFQRLWEGRQRDFIERGNWAPTLNLIVRKSVFDRIGDFDATVLSGSDVEWGRRAARAGVVQVYGDEAIVRHEARHSLLALVGQEARNADAMYQLFFRLEPKRFNYFRGLLFMTFLPGWRSLSVRRFREKNVSLPEIPAILFVNETLRWVRIYEFFRMSLGGTARRA